MTTMRVLIVTRIFTPEIAAAAFRLRALATAWRDAGHEVSVITARPPRSSIRPVDDPQGVSVGRWPVLRDRNGQVRGYLPYTSFDVGALVRTLFARKPGVIVVEPPPTTAWLTSLVAKLRRIPHVYYSADCSSDAVKAAGVSDAVARVVLALERGAVRRSSLVLTVNPAIADRLVELHPGANVVSIGNGVDTEIFTSNGPAKASSNVTVLYAGTVSEWQKAGVLMDAWRTVIRERPDARLVIVGSGGDWARLKQQSLNDDFLGSVDVLPPEPPHDVAARFRGARVSVVTLAPGIGYDYAIPTKLMASLCCGTPVIFAGDGASEAVVSAIPAALSGGRRVHHDSAALAKGILEEIGIAHQSRDDLAQWAAARFSLDTVGERAVMAIRDALRSRPATQGWNDDSHTRRNVGGSP